MEPARSIIQRLGGEAVVSQITGTAYTAPYRWQHPKERGGTGGLIPQKHHPVMLDYARAHDISLTAADFLPRPEQPEDGTPLPSTGKASAEGAPNGRVGA